MHFYKVFRSKKDLGVRTSKPIWAGISVHGVLTAEQQGSVRAVTRTHAWQNTQKISFKRRRFSIKPKSEVGIGKVAKLDYYTDSHRKCDTLCSFIIYCDNLSHAVDLLHYRGRYLLKLATAHHRFHITMKMRSNLHATDVTPQGTAALLIALKEYFMFLWMQSSRGKHARAQWQQTAKRARTVLSRATRERMSNLKPTQSEA